MGSQSHSSTACLPSLDGLPRLANVHALDGSSRPVDVPALEGQVLRLPAASHLYKTVPWRQQSKTIVEVPEVQYTVMERLGGGGFGVVYRVKSESGEEFAAKITQVQCGSAHRAARRRRTFAVEAAVHTHALQCLLSTERELGRVFLPLVHYIGEVDQLCVIVMEVAQGTLAGRRFSGPAWARIAWALASTLDFLNGVGSVHGDLKPSNVLWREGGASKEPNGWPMLADFGSAQDFSSMWLSANRLDPGAKISVSGHTEDFTAPEVMREYKATGKLNLSVRSEMWSWAKTIEHAARHVAGALPERLHEMLQACCAEEPGLRPDSFRPVAAHLEDSGCLEWGRLFAQRQQDSEHFQPDFLHAAAAQASDILARTRCEVSEEDAEDNRDLLQGLSSRIAREMAGKAECGHNAQIHRLLGAIHTRCKRFDLALHELQTSLDLLEVQEGASSAIYCETLRVLAHAYRGLGDHVEEQRTLERCLALVEGVHGPQHPLLIELLTVLSDAHAARGDTQEQVRLLAGAIDVHKAAFPDSELPGSAHHEDLEGLRVLLRLAQSGGATRAQPAEANEDAPCRDVEVHRHLVCDGCHKGSVAMVLLGRLWHCRHCPDLDFCAACYDKRRASHTLGHEFEPRKPWALCTMAGAVPPA